MPAFFPLPSMRFSLFFFLPSALSHQQQQQQQQQQQAHRDDSSPSSPPTCSDRATFEPPYCGSNPNGKGCLLLGGGGPHLGVFSRLFPLFIPSKRGEFGCS